MNILNQNALLIKNKALPDRRSQPPELCRTSCRCIRKTITMRAESFYYDSLPIKLLTKRHCIRLKLICTLNNLML